MTLSQHAGDTFNPSNPRPEPAVAPVILARLTNLTGTPVADIPSPLIEAHAATSNHEPAEHTAAAPAARTSQDAGGTPLGHDNARYYLASELDRRPTPLTPVNLPYPSGDPQAEGYLLLQLYINETGRVDKVEVLLNDGADAIAPIAVKVFGDVVFSPGMRSDRPVKSKKLIELKLRPEATAGR